MAWATFRLLRSLDWSHLPEAGGVLDQNEAIWEDLLTVRWRYDLLEKLWNTGQIATAPGGIKRDLRKADSGVPETA